MQLANALTEKGICVTPTCYAQLKRNLATLVDNDEDRKEMLTTAIAYGLPKLKASYANKNKSNRFCSKNAISSKSSKPKQEEDLSEDAFELAVDENGNPLLF